MSMEVYGNDKNYLQDLKKFGIPLELISRLLQVMDPTTNMLEAGTLPGSAVGLDSGSSLEILHWQLK